MGRLSSMKRILFIINPISGVGRQKLVEKYAENILDKTRCTFDFVYTQYSRHAEAIAKDTCNNYEIIVAVGGDGTINEIASGLNGSQCTMAIIPTGSGNGLARCLGIPLKIKKALKLINTGIVRKIDTISCNGKCFINVGGIGFDAEIGHLFDTAEKRGLLTYVKITLAEILYFKPRQYELNFDGKTRSVEALLISVANSTQWGNDIKIAPMARVDDGLVDICILKKFPLIMSPLIAFRLISGTITRSKYFETFSVSRIAITQEEVPLKYHLDGEPMINESKTLEINVHPLSISVLVP